MIVEAFCPEMICVALLPMSVSGFGTDWRNAAEFSPFSSEALTPVNPEPLPEITPVADILPSEYTPNPAGLMALP